MPLSLFDPFALRSVQLRNRIGVSPMCQYSSVNGFANDWHVVHLGARAVGGAGLIITEAAAVLAHGRISPQDLGIWSDAHVEGLARVTHFASAHGAVPSIQLAHAGRKANTRRPWEGGQPIPDPNETWRIVGASAVPFKEGHPTPHTLSLDEISEIKLAFRQAAQRSHAAGFKLIEIHAAHGYLLHSFYSPLANLRADEYGGSFENRTRLLLEVVGEIRSVWPDELPLAVRLSCSDWVDGGWTIEHTVALAKLLKQAGVDLIDCSSGGNAAQAKVPATPGYQVPFAEAIRRDARIATAAVGLITQPAQANEIVCNEQADIVLLGREVLRDPYWPLHAERVLKGNAEDSSTSTNLVPPQYARAF